MSRYIIEAQVTSISSEVNENRFVVCGAGENYFIKRGKQEFNVFWPYDDEAKLPELKEAKMKLYASTSLQSLISGLFQSKSRLQFVVKFIKHEESENSKPEEEKLVIEKILWPDSK
jgi:hypothetical protein